MFFWAPPPPSSQPFNFPHPPDRTLPGHDVPPPSAGDEDIFPSSFFFFSPPPFPLPSFKPFFFPTFLLQTQMKKWMNLFFFSSSSFLFLFLASSLRHSNANREINTFTIGFFLPPPPPPPFSPSFSTLIVSFSFPLSSQ